MSGFQRKLLPVQAHAVWHSLRQIHGLTGSVILAHVMGIGKTTMAFAIHHVQHVVNLMYADIRDYPDQHINPKSADYTNGAIPCPFATQMYAKYGFYCPCAAGSPTRFIKERLGVSVALVPTGLLDTWTAEHRACFKPGSQLLERAHHSKGGIKLDQWKFLRGEEEKHSINGHPNTSTFYPRLENSTCFVLSTSDSVEKHFLLPKQNQDVKSYNFTPDPEMKKQKDGTMKKVQHKPKLQSCPSSQSVIVSLFFKDEFHLRQSKAIQAITRIQDLQNIRLQSIDPLAWGVKRFFRVALVLMSGTPLTNGPLDIAPFVKRMVVPAWGHDNVLRNWMGEELTKLGERWKAYCATKIDRTAADEVLISLPPLVEKLFLRWTTESDLLGHQCVRVPPNFFEKISCSYGEY